ncbi:LysR family transcriptional regulator [uncultured Massilia sp.]|uniref:LysR substrate-binding domain-containing protein n=1 Tax=uncultured Massilia sp. TaxID=169973 RepID=UPI0025D8718A|nr:LysR family transcriptional regulator [uncultured Massilia sp.]
MRGIELRQLRYFAILAQELHFRKAADLAFITQPALSQQISKLEEFVGVALFVRDGRRVALTPAGAVLQEELDKMFEQLQRALRLTRETADEREFVLSLGMVEYTNLPFIPPALVRLRAAYPGLKVLRHEMHAGLQFDALARNIIDVGVGVPAFMPTAGSGIAARPVLSGPWVAVMRADHPLAARTSLSVADLAGERLVFFERQVVPHLHDMLVGACRRAGFTPQFVYETQQVQMGISMASEGAGLMIGAAYIFTALPPGVTMRPIADLGQLTVHLFMRAAEPDALVHEFAEAVMEEAFRTQVLLNAKY